MISVLSVKAVVWVYFMLPVEGVEEKKMELGQHMQTQW